MASAVVPYVVSFLFPIIAIFELSVDSSEHSMVRRETALTHEVSL